MQLDAVGAQAFAAHTQRHIPVTAHLQVFVDGFHGLVVECVFRALFFLRPDQRFMRVGEAHAAEVGHGVGFDPHHIVQDPETKVLQNRANPVDVVITADHPQGPGGFQYTPAGGEPVTSEGIIFGKAGETVPVRVDAVHQ